MAWVGDFVFTLAAGLSLAFTINIPERQETVLHDLREVAPTMYLAAPRAWDHMLTRVQVGIAESTPLKRGLFDWFMQRAVEVERRRLDGRSPTARERVLRQLGEWLVFAPIRDILGLSRARARLHRRRSARRRHVPRVPRARHQPQAVLRPDRDRRADGSAGRRRHQAAHGRPADAQRRRAHRRARRDPGALGVRLRRATTTTRRPRPRRCTTAGSRPATPAIWNPTATSSCSVVSARSCTPPPANAMSRTTSRTG